MKRALAAVLAAALAAPAAAYLPPATAILKRVAQRRADAAPAAMEVRGGLVFVGAAAERAAAAMGLAPSSGELAAPAVLLVKAPGRCRLELTPDGLAPADRPAVSVKAGRVLGRRGLDAVPAARALLEGVCALLAERGGGAEPERALAHSLIQHGVALQDVALGRLGGRVAWVIGGRPQEQRPQAWVDKQTLQPIRLVASLAGALRDVRLLDYGSPVAGDAFPRAVEVWDGGQLAARLVTEKLTPNPRAPDAMF